MKTVVLSGKEWDGVTVEEFVTLMDMGYDFPWEDSTAGVPCVCGARWKKHKKGWASMGHTPSCPYCKGADLQAERREASA